MRKRFEQKRRKGRRTRTPIIKFEMLELRRLLSLTHLYTFNDGTANDSVGGANGTLVHGATVVEGWLTLQNYNGTSSNALSTALISGSPQAQYAQLPAGVLPSSGSATIEVWYTSSSAMQNWERIFDFGDQVNGAGNSYLFFTPRSATSDARTALKPAGGSERVATLAGGTFDGRAHMAAVVVDAAAGQLRLYIDGTLANSVALSGAGLNNINAVLGFLGRSMFDADPAYSGAIDEVRIYNDAEGAPAITAQAVSGATRVAPTLPAKQIENLDRGVVAFNRASSQVYMSWRLLATDPDSISFNVYRSTNGGAAVKRNSTPITKTTDFTDTGVNQAATNDYFVRAVINGVEQGDSKHFTIAANTAVNQYLNIPLNVPPGGTNPDGSTYTYNANDASVGDLDGDGQYEIVVKWDPSPSYDSSQDGFTGPTLFDAYRLDGTFMWRINLGQNIRAGAHYTQFMVYDLDGDGKAEIVMKTAPGTIDGAGAPVLMGADKVTDDYRNATTGRINTGPEYLTVFRGTTGAQLATVAFKPDRINTSSWGDDYGNRQDRILMAIAYLDGSRPSLVVGRGIFPGQSSGHAVRNEITAWNFRGGSLTMLWWFRADQNTGAYGLPNVNTSYIGQGTYNMHPADVDGDGKDEIMYGEMAVNSNGTPRYSTGLGHGDAMHVSDLDPTRPGEEVFMPEESPGSYGIYGGALRDASSGQPLEAIDGHNADVGRGVAVDIDPRYVGAEMWQSADGFLYDVKGDVIQAKPSNMFQNFVIQWDADPQYELLDGTTISNWTINAAGVGGRSNFTLSPPVALSSNNGSKSTPALTADIFGDYREEVIWRTADNTALQIWSTVIPANSRMETEMDDVQYREAIAWQNVGYNQPPHTSYYLGDGMKSLPVANVYFPGGPNNITLSGASIAENQPVGTTVGNLASTTLGTSNTFTYAFVDGAGSVDNGAFQIVGGQLRTNASFDFENKRSYTVRIRTTDAAGMFYDRQLTIGVTDVNEAPTLLSLTNAVTSLPELSNTSTHIKIADIVVTDDALGNETLALTGADAGSFEIVGSTLYLKAGTALNYDVKSSYSVTVTADDPTVGATPDVSASTTVAINDAPKVATPAAAAPNPLTGTTASVSVLGSDDGGEAALTYTWSVVGVPPAVVFADNGTHTARNTTATFTRAGTYQLQAAITDAAGQTILSSTTLTVYSSIAGRDVFYGGSAFDAGGHDGAIAPDKVALLPGQTAGFVNYTSFSRGLNGVIVDIAMPAGNLTTADFAFRVGNDDTPAAWGAAPVPTSVVNRPGAGVGGSTRVEINWADNAIQNQWIEVTVKGGGNTGLAGDDLFYFGNTPGEVDNDAASARVDAVDQLDIRYNSSASAGLGSLYDVNRDGRVDSGDESVARGNVTYFLNELHLIAPPVAGGPVFGFAGLAAAQPTGPTAPSVQPVLRRVPLNLLPAEVVQPLWSSAWAPVAISPLSTVQPREGIKNVKVVLQRAAKRGPDPVIPLLSMQLLWLHPVA